MTNAIVMALSLILAAENATDSTVSSQGAVGQYQIRQVCLTDANRFMGTAYTLPEMSDPVKARKVAEAYLKHYGNGKSVKWMVRCWLAGPTGANRFLGEWYWQRAIANMWRQAKDKKS